MMSEYYWDSTIEYLRNTRGLYYNDDYLEFLVKNVWKMNAPVNIVDYGCGYGYLGLKLLPLLPEGSTYTGIDKGEDLIKEAREVFDKLPYSTEFIQGDIEDMFVHRQYDVAICHAFLLHMANPRMILQKWSIVYWTAAESFVLNHIGSPMLQIMASMRFSIPRFSV
jgi:2-polyprenyl-3-methyl-5-hydroxy-6-metoxy-1,4-benzoquinol methylase